MKGIFSEILVISLKYLQILEINLLGNNYFSLFVPLRMRDTQCYCVLHRIVTDHKLPKSRMQIANKTWTILEWSLNYVSGRKTYDFSIGLSRF